MICTWGFQHSARSQSLHLSPIHNGHWFSSCSWFCIFFNPLNLQWMLVPRAWTNTRVHTYFSFYIIYLLWKAEMEERKRERKRDRERERMREWRGERNLFADSLPNAGNTTTVAGSSWTLSPPVSHVGGRDSPSSAITCCLQGAHWQEAAVRRAMPWAWTLQHRMWVARVTAQPQCQIATPDTHFWWEMFKINPRLHFFFCLLPLQCCFLQ